MRADSPLLLLTGTHPAAAWLANGLTGRGLPVLWGRGENSPYPWWALSPHAFAPYGEAVPNWPLEWTFQLNQALALFHPQQGLHLSARESVLLDLPHMQRDLHQELGRRDIPQAHTWQAPSAKLSDQGHTRPARWCVEINFLPCSRCRDWEYSDLFAQAPSPAGLLEWRPLQNGTLWSSSLGAGRSALSYRAQAPDSDAMQMDLRTYWPRHTGFLQPQNWHPACHCPPQLERTEQHLLLTVSPPSLHPQAQLAQSLVWLAAQALMRWLSEGSAVLDTLDRDWQAYLDKVSAAPVRLGQIHKFPGDPA